MYKEEKVLARSHNIAGPGLPRRFPTSGTELSWSVHVP